MVSGIMHTKPFVNFLLTGLIIATFGGDLSLQKESRTLVTGDSARIISPKTHTILNREPVTLEVKPFCAVSRVDLLVHYYPFRTDTLARLTGAPFKTLWNNHDLVDQDQLHLQFGYILYHANGDTILSPPLPHHWIIDRTVLPSRKRYVCKQIPPEKKIQIDGKLDEWRRFRRVPFPSGGGFRCAWTAADFFCAIEVYDPFVTAGDRVEVSFDLTLSRSRFLDIDHRIISFGPEGRSFSWAIDVSDTGVRQIDSVIIRIGEEMEWRRQITDYGYIIETRIPFCVLSALEFPQKHFGFDICVVNRDDSKQKEPSVYTWSGAHPAGRHNPAEWGTVVLRQLLLPVKMVLFTGLIIIILFIIGMLFLIFYKKQKDYLYERKEQKGFSLRLQEIIRCMERKIAQTDLDSASIARYCGCTNAELTKIFSQELNTTCENYIVLMRIKKAKSLLAESAMSIDALPPVIGFSDKELFVNTFTALAGVSPEKWRKNRLEDALDDDIEDDGKDPEEQPQ